VSALTWLALIASTAIDLAVLLAILLRGAPRPLGVGRLASALIAAGVASAVKAPVLVAFARSFFFAVHLAYYDVVIALPIAAAVVLVASRRRPVTRAVRGLACAACALPLAGVYATFVEPLRLVEERATIPISPRRAGRAALRVAVLADIQGREVEPQMRAAVASAMQFEPHLIVLPGDLIQRESDEYDAVVPEFRDLLRPLDAPLGVYFTLGNTDDPQRVARAFEGTRVRLLRNEVVELDFADRKIVLGGGGMNVRGGLEQSFVRELESRAGDDDVRLLVTHYPDALLLLPHDSRTDLVIAGHTHGGQVQLPFVGPLITLSSVPRAVAGGGYHVVDGRAVYLSRGIGSERGAAPRIRFLAPPEVSLLTLETP
jgi:predicted MPP superfamily phosphohydrolase